jgi:hypothetical protein
LGLGLQFLSYWGDTVQPTIAELLKNIHMLKDNTLLKDIPTHIYTHKHTHTNAVPVFVLLFLAFQMEM